MAQLSSLPQPLVAGASENIADVVTNLEALRTAVNGIDADQINAGAVGVSELASAITNSLVPLGTVIDWYPPNAAAAPWTSAMPTGYAACDGTAWSSIVNDLGFTTGVIPDLRGAFVAGADPALARGAASTNAGVGGTVGANSKVLAAGQVPSHTHTIGSSGAHTHNTDYAGTHSHRSGGDAAFITQLTAGNAGGYLTTVVKTATYTNSYETYSLANTMDAGNHYHSISSSGAHGHDVPAPATNSQAVDFRPATVGLLKIMKVRNTV